MEVGEVGDTMDLLIFSSRRRLASPSRTTRSNWSWSGLESRPEYSTDWELRTKGCFNFA